MDKASPESNQNPCERSQRSMQCCHNFTRLCILHSTYKSDFWLSISSEGMVFMFLQSPVYTYFLKVLLFGGRQGVPLAPQRTIIFEPSLLDYCLLFHNLQELYSPIYIEFYPIKDLPI